MQDLKEYADKMIERYQIIGRAHYITAARLAARHHWFGYPASVISGAVGATLIATFRADHSATLKLLAGIISLVGGLLTTLQTFHNFAEAAQRHKAAGSRYMAIRRRLKLFGLRYISDDAANRQTGFSELEQINTELTELATEAPALPDRYWEQANEEHGEGRFLLPMPRPQQALPK